MRLLAKTRCAALSRRIDSEIRLATVLYQYGLARFTRAIAIMQAMEKSHPREPCFYLTFIASSPEFHGLGLGSRILKATLRQIDAAGMAAYVESSNPKNATFYERVGFVAQKNIAPANAPPLIAMLRNARAK